ncbi:DUF602-domain-containing protein [Schizopora paradoxa]|uniref:DUF602-domain-containing protein n=1 Tax=Schizopora paradoxa TaxID=27342 RepID=A0A0H2S144_9AGAM|nr:DUF602-domain-containing protein [Schizopora paradoxa]
MGNDGGSIPDRRDLVRTKPKAEQADKANQTRARWFFCALSKRRLEEPVVSCALGKLYNKDALLEYLLDKSAYGDGEEICGHIKSLKDVKTLKLSPNPAPSLPSEGSTNASAERAQFICPLNLKEMNGAQPFIYIATCGCVLSQAGLKAVATTPSKDSAEDQLELCPQCSTKFNRSEDVRMINPDPETEETMRIAMEIRREKAKAAKGSGKSKKRKADKETAAAEDGDEKSAKKAKASTQPAPSINPSVATASRAVVSSLAAEEAKRKAQMSDAVRSLYESKNPNQKESFMTGRTFNRYA